MAENKRLTPEQVEEMRRLVAEANGLRGNEDRINEWSDACAAAEYALFRHATALLDAADAERGLRKVTERVAGWLERLEGQSKQQASVNRGRFDSLADACEADARNYGKVARDCRAALGGKEPS